MDHAFDLNLSREDRILYGIRPGMTVVGVWTPGVEIDSPIARVCAALSFSNEPLVGWTKGVQWVVSRGSLIVRMFLGAKRLSFFFKDQTVALYADDGIIPIIALLIEEIRESILEQQIRIAQCPKVIHDFVDAEASLKAENFPRWSATVSREANEDPLHKALYDRYQAEFIAAEAGYQKRMRDALLSQCKTRGARYVSINSSLFCVFEDIRTDGIPVAQQIAEDLNIFAGSYGSFGVRTMNTLTLCGHDIQGVWRVDGDEPVRVTTDSFRESHRSPSAGHRAILRGRGDMDEIEWLTECAVIHPF